MAATASPLPGAIAWLEAHELRADNDDVGFASAVGRFRPYLWRDKKVSVLTLDASDATGFDAAAIAMHRLGSSPQTLHVYGVSKDAIGRRCIVMERIAHGCPGRLFAAPAQPAASSLFSLSLSGLLSFVSPSSEPPPPSHDALAFVSLQEVLDHYRTSPPLPERARLSLALAIAEAVASLHVRGIVHGAITPATILVATLDDRLVVKLIDVGARALAAYSAPERNNHAPATEAADVYAIGALFAHLVANGMSLQATSVADLIKVVQLGRRPLRGQLCPESYVYLVQRCMADEATARPPIAYVVAYCREAIEKSDAMAKVRSINANELGTLELMAFDSVLDYGTFSILYHGMLDGRDVAVKSLSHHTTNEMFENEVWLLAELGANPHTVELFGTSVSAQGHRQIVMELMRGRNLRHHLGTLAASSGGPQDLHRLLPIALEIVEALRYLHERNIIHRDLKTTNVLLDARGHIKLADFGVGRKATGRTMTERIGTSRYMAPEVFNGSNYTTAADMYSFGVLLTVLTTLLEPFAGCTESDVKLHARIRDEGLRPRLDTNCPPALAALARQCMHLDPCERPTAGAAVNILQPLVWALSPLPIIPSPLLQIASSPVGHPKVYFYRGISVVLEPAPRGHDIQHLVLKAYRINSEHTVHVLGLVCDTPAPMVVLEATTGLRTFLQRRSCHVMALVRATAEAIAAIHDRKAVVTHLVPNAIVINSSERVKLKSGGVDATGAALYMAPEVAAGAAPTFASNVYSLGTLWATLWHARGETSASYPPGYADLVKDCTLVDPAGRPSARQVVHRLVALQ